MLLGLLWLAAATFAGATLTLLWDDDGPFLPRLAAGAVLGVTLFGLVGYPLAAWRSLGPLPVVLAGVLVVVPVALLARLTPRLRRVGMGALSIHLPRRPGAWLRAAALILLAGVLVACVQRAFFMRPDGLYTGDDHNLADLPFHLAIVQGFVEGQRFPPEHPDLAGVRLTYPFLVDFVAAQLVALGASLEGAFLLENALLMLALLVLLHRLGRRLTDDPAAAAVVPWLVFLSGGLGFTDLVREADPLRGGLAGLLTHLPHDYTIRFDGGLRFGNLVTTMLLPQRALLLGLPLAVLAVTLLWDSLTAEAAPRARQRLLAAGAVAGIMPLAHAHSFLVVMGAAAALALLFPRRDWWRFFAVAAVIALPVILWMAHDSPTQARRFVAWHLGWDRGAIPPLLFWIRNAGVFLLLAIAGYAWGGPSSPAPGRLRRFLAPFALCFLVPNLLQLSPWIWDNIKLLIYAYVFAAPLVALVLVRAWRRGGWRRPAALVLGAGAMLSGALDVGRVASRQIAHRLYDSDALAFVDAVIAATPGSALIAHAPTHETPLFLSGRRSLLGFPGHLWSQGLDGGSREADLERIYAGTPDAGSLLRGHGVEYLVWGPQEQARMGEAGGVMERFPLVVAIGPYRLLDAAAPGP